MRFYEAKVSGHNKSEKTAASSPSQRIRDSPYEVRRFIDEYFSWTLAIVNKMHIHGERIADVAMVEKSLQSMAPKFSYVSIK